MHPTFATSTFGQVALTIFEFAVLCSWIWLGVRVLIDVFASDDLSGWSKAGWLLVVVLVPLFGGAAYLIARGDAMAARSAKREREQPTQPRRTMTSAPSDIATLQVLRERGILSEEDYRHGKEQALQ
jgi:Phospholipase_D-nuclease N-terminal